MNNNILAHPPDAHAAHRRESTFGRFCQILSTSTTVAVFRWCEVVARRPSGLASRATGDDVSGQDPGLRQTHGDPPDLLNRPADQSAAAIASVLFSEALADLPD
jgi:hypothetical protein